MARNLDWRTTAAQLARLRVTGRAGRGGGADTTGGATAGDDVPATGVAGTGGPAPGAAGVAGPVGTRIRCRRTTKMTRCPSGLAAAGRASPSGAAARAPSSVLASLPAGEVAAIAATIPKAAAELNPALNDRAEAAG